MSNETSIDLKQCVLDAVLSGLIALVVFGPIVGVVLDGYGFNLHYERVGWIIAIVMGGRFLLSLYLQTRGGRAVLERFEGAGSGVHVLPPGYKTRLRWIVPLILVAAVIFPFFASKYLLAVVILGLIYVLLGLGLNIVVGLAGLLDLGYVGFYAVGAYTYALLAEYAGFGFWTALPIAGMMAALFGFLLGFPVLRLRGDYLAIVTLGFGEIIRILLRNMTEITGGPNGIGSIPKPTLFGLTFERRAPEGMQTFHEFFGIAYNTNYKVILLYVVALLLVLLALFVINRLMRMPIGRAWEALREDEVACRALGLNPTIVKLSAFTIGASFAGFAGSFFAARQGLVTPESFTFIESAMILAIVVLGGMGSQLGVILAAVVMVLLQEMRGFNEYRMLIFGLTMIVMMIWRPQGLLPMQRPHLELKP